MKGKIRKKLHYNTLLKITFSKLTVLY